MSTENVTSFLNKAATDPALQAQVAEAYRAAQQATADALATLSTETGTPFTAEEFLAAQTQELSEKDLEGVAGGFSHFPKERPPEPL